MRFDKIDLYPVTCEPLSRGRSSLEVLRALISGGARIVQLREKEKSARELFELAVKFREITAANNAMLIINDHLDIALAVGADGAHLGQSDLPCAVARKLAPRLIIGISTHTLGQALQAEKDGADYVNLGPIFDTSTKGGLIRGVGVGFIKRAAARLSIPFTVMGGINDGNIDKVLDAGARRVAMVTALTQAKDITEAAAFFIHKIRSRAQSDHNYT